MSLQNKSKINKIINVLSQWVKKPSLDHDISVILCEYRLLIANGVHNFSETSVIIRDYSTIYEKKVNILHKELLTLSFRLCEVLRPPVPESIEIVNPEETNNSEQLTQTENGQSEVNITSVTISTTSTTATTITTTNPIEIKRKRRKSKIEDRSQNSVQIPISNFPPEILESLNINNCNVEEIIKTCREKLTPNDPLYSVFVKNSNEINRKNTIIRKGIELRENSWFQFQFLEVHLEKNCLNNNVKEEIIDNIENSLEYHSMEITQNSTTVVVSENDCTRTSITDTEIMESGIELNPQFECTNDEDICREENLTENITASANNNLYDNSQILTETQNTSEYTNNDETLLKQAAKKYNLEFKEIKINLLRLPNYTSNSIQLSNEFPSESNIHNIIVSKLKIDLKNLNVNLLKLSGSFLSRISYFKLSNEYLDRSKRRNDEDIKTHKRKQDLEKECLALTKKLKSYDLHDFETFVHTYNVSNGLCSPSPDKINATLCRKSVDNRSEISYSCPVTPDSGRASMFQTDSELEHLDTDGDHDHETDNDAVIRGASRADSGCIMSPCHENDSALPYSSEPVPVEEDPVLQKLKEMFPRSFSDPSRAEYLKQLIPLPEESHQTENYVSWKNFIDDKTAKENEFNIHQYGTDVLNSFTTKSKDEVIDFKNIVKDKPVEEISRYFVSLLQLANTGNIELCNEHPGEVYNDGLKLKFLKEDRPHEMFDEETASQSFVENLPSTSTPSTSDSWRRNSANNRQLVKRRRIDY